MDYLVSRSFVLPVGKRDMTETTWFVMWRRESKFSRDLTPGDRIYWYETPSQTIMWLTGVRTVKRYRYKSKRELVTRLTKDFGNINRSQAYLRKGPDAGVCLAWQVEALERLDLAKPREERFPQHGWLAVDQHVRRRWLKSDAFPPVLFVRVGWMQSYAGPVPGDERPIGGGSYNRRKLGHEAYNFQVRRGRLYGYYQPHMASDQTALERVNPAGDGADALHGVTVVFVARKPKGGGQVVVGWYRNATVYRRLKPRTPGRKRGFGYRCAAAASDCMLVPVPNRTFSVVGGRGGFGQTNVCYPREANGESKAVSWMGEALRYIDSYTTSNALLEPEATAEEDVVQALEQAQSRSQGQGFPRTARERVAIEQLGMRRAEQYFRRSGWRVDDVHRTHSYDLRCTKGSRVLCVEVKATMSLGRTVFVTHREAELAQRSDVKSALFVLHSVQLRRGRATGGHRRVLVPWQPKDEDLKAITYSCMVR